MKPQTPPDLPTDDLFRHRLENLIDMRHELVKLAALIDWEYFDAKWGETFSEDGRPGIATRRIAGLHYLKHTYGLSDEQVVMRWAENPYWQYFCGETYFQHQLPLNPSSLTRWRQRLGGKGIELLLSTTIDAAIESKAVKRGDLKRVTVDTTVQEKAIAFPTDSRLYNEDLHSEVTQSIRIDEEIYSGSTDYQSVRIFRNDLLGRVLVLDGAVQVTELDEHIYSEMMVHVPLLSHPDPKNLLIIGGGDGTCLREVVKHSSVERAVLAELDGQLIALCKTHLSEIVRNSFGHEKAVVHIGDGVAFVRDTDIKFDVIIVDSTDPAGPSEPLFTKEFYLACKNALAEGGILIAQAGCPAYQKDFSREIGNFFSSLFTRHGYYQAAVPSYIGGLHAFAWGSDQADLARPTVREAAFPTRYYSDDTRRAGFLLPV